MSKAREEWWWSNLSLLPSPKATALHEMQSFKHAIYLSQNHQLSNHSLNNHLLNSETPQWEKNHAVGNNQRSVLKYIIFLEMAVSIGERSHLWEHDILTKASKKQGHVYHEKKLQDQREGHRSVCLDLASPWGPSCLQVSLGSFVFQRLLHGRAAEWTSEQP